MILTENYGNLNRLDSSFFYTNENKPIELDMKRTTKISPNSEVIIDKNFRPHSASGIVNSLDDENNAAIILRIFNRQLLLITREDIYYSSWDSNKYALALTPYLMNLIPDLSYHRVTYANNKKYVESFIKKIFEAYGNKFGKKVKWDVIIVKSDEKAKKEIIDKRASDIENVEVKPNESKYKDFIEGLKKKWQEKCKKYIETHLPNTTNIQEIKNFLLNHSAVESFVFNGEKYIHKFDRYDSVWINRENTIKYERENKADDGKFNYIEIYIVFKGFKIYITKILGAKKESSFYGRDKTSWEEIL